MPAKSKAQQMAAGAALSAKRGDTKAGALKGASKSMYKSMSEKELARWPAPSKRASRRTRPRADRCRISQPHLAELRAPAGSYPQGHEAFQGGYFLRGTQGPIHPGSLRALLLRASGMASVIARAKPAMLCMSSSTWRRKKPAQLKSP